MAIDVSRIVSREMVEQIVREVAMKKLHGFVKQTPKLAVHASARHIHLCRADLDALFGAGYQLTVERPLYQAGNFAAKETVALIGPRSRLLSNLRILGPLRKESQVELAFTDAISLGIDAPIRLSGDIEGTPGCFILGPKGMAELKRGVIRAAIHVHMNPEEAEYFEVNDGGMMKLRVGGGAGVTFNCVRVRVDPASRLDVHMDTDEANGCGLHLAKDIELFK